MEAIHERFHELEAWMARGRIGQRLGFTRIERDRLLAQHVLPCLERANRPGDVEIVRQRIVDGVDVRIREELFVRSVCRRDAERARRGKRPRLVT